MPYRPEGELKRPDLKGEFTCGVCFKRFCHAASLNRHRLNFHSGNHHCRLCNGDIPNGENLKSHMAITHQIERVFTCGCCNWAFPDKKELHQHTSAMMKTGEPGSAKPIATNLNVVPGSMVAERSPGLYTPRTSSPGTTPKAEPCKPQEPIATAIPLAANPIFPSHALNNGIQTQLLKMLAAQLETANGPPPAWLSAFLANNAMLPTVMKNIYTNNNDGTNSEATDTSHSEDEQSSSGRNDDRATVVPSPLTSQVATPECVDSPLSIEVASPSSPASTSGQSATSETELTSTTVIMSPGGAMAKRKRTIDDVVSFLAKKKNIPA
ncbi:unnamed protein product, partial [Mesorhabditis spiculigera]